MRGWTMLLLLALAACGKNAETAPAGMEQRAIDRSVADVAAAEAAAAAPMPPPSESETSESVEADKGASRARR